MPNLSEARLETARLCLRPYSKKDADSVFGVICRKEISSMTMRIPFPCPRDYADHWIGWIIDGRRQGVSCEFGLFKKENGGYVGNCGLADIVYKHRQASVAYFIDPAEWGNGYATEALIEIFRFGFSYLGLEKMTGKCFADNPASRRVMEKAGMKLEGIARRDIYRDGVFADVCMMGILKDEWGNANL